jgi:hypothetical protein
MGLAVVKSILAGAAFASAMVLSVGAHANVYQTFDLEWSGTVGPYGISSNTDTASAVITFDLTQLATINGTSTGTFLNFWITSFSLTVSGASAGNGTFGLSDFAVMVDPNGAVFDFTKDLVGQHTSGKDWGTTYDGTSGDFNLAPFIGDPPTVPVGITLFTMVTNGGFGDPLTLTSFAPVGSPFTCSLAEDCVATTPLPPTLPLFATGLGALGLLLLREKRKAAAALAA